MSNAEGHLEQKQVTALQRIVDAVLEATLASRVTMRLEIVGFAVAAEALLPDVPSLKPLPPPADVRADPVARHVFDKLELVAVDAVEDDMDADDPRRAYRITAEIVAPIVANERCVGVISVHEVRGERQWAPEEVAAVTSATAQAHEILYPGRRSEASS